jgi:hypothetical protein
MSQFLAYDELTWPEVRLLRDILWIGWQSLWEIQPQYIRCRFFLMVGMEVGFLSPNQSWKDA